jgi:site-specific DNA-cytosine methylase
MFRIIREFRPLWVFIENVPALRTRGADRVLADLEGEGYSCRSSVVGACHAGATHERKRVYIVAYRSRDREAWTASATRTLGERNRECSTEGSRANSFGVSGNMRSAKSKRETKGGTAASGTGDSRVIDVAHYIQVGREKRSRDSKYKTRTGSGRSESTVEGAVAESSLTRLSERRTSQIGPGAKKSMSSGLGSPFPSPPGREQHPGERPRLVKFGVGGSDDGISVRLFKLANMEALAGYGNAVVPQVVQAFGESIIRLHEGGIVP